MRIHLEYVCGHMCAHIQHKLVEKRIKRSPINPMLFLKEWMNEWMKWNEMKIQIMNCDFSVKREKRGEKMWQVRCMRVSCLSSFFLTNILFQPHDMTWYMYTHSFLPSLWQTWLLLWEIWEREKKKQTIRVNYRAFTIRPLCGENKALVWTIEQCNPKAMLYISV